MIDGSNGYEAVAEVFIQGRGTTGRIGASTVRDWAGAFPKGSTVLDLGCGPGMPISDVLLQEGLVVYGIDASPRMVAAFRARFPETQCECNTIESSSFFNRTFDAVIAWGLIFLLPPSNQSRLIHKVAGVLKRGGQFVFTAPSEVSQWSDNLTGLTSFGLGTDSYKRELESAGFEFMGDRTDEGNNYYYISRLAQ